MRPLVVITLLLVFAIPATAQNEITGKNASSDYKNMDQKPEYPGGMQGIGDFLSSNLIYPENARKISKEGRVIVRFVIDTTGNVSAAATMNTVYPSLDSEALRVVRLMKGWKPGTIKGKKTPVYYTIPISFKLTD